MASTDWYPCTAVVNPFRSQYLTINCVYCLLNICHKVFLRICFLTKQYPPRLWFSFFSSLFCSKVYWYYKEKLPFHFCKGKILQQQRSCSVSTTVASLLTFWNTLGGIQLKTRWRIVVRFTIIIYAIGPTYKGKYLILINKCSIQVLNLSLRTINRWATHAR